MLMAEIFHVTKIQMLVYMYVLPCSLYWNSMLWTFFGLFFHFTYTLTIHVCLLYYIYLTGGYLVIIAEGQIPIEVGRILPPSRWAIPLDISNPRCGRAQPFLTDPYLWEHFYLSGRNQMSQGGSRALHLFGPLWNPPDSISKRWQKMLWLDILLSSIQCLFLRFDDIDTSNQNFSFNPYIYAVGGPVKVFLVTIARTNCG